MAHVVAFGVVVLIVAIGHWVPSLPWLFSDFLCGLVLAELWLCCVGFWLVWIDGCDVVASCGSGGVAVKW